jgi:hypothetical protein
MADIEEIRERDWERLTPEGKALAVMLVGLRSGKTLREAAEKLGVVVDHVVDMSYTDDNGNVKGPKGTVTLTLEVCPDPDGGSGTVLVNEKVAHRYPEDRGHVLYTGKNGTLHTRQETAGMLFAVEDGEIRTLGDGDGDDPQRRAAQAD